MTDVVIDCAGAAMGGAARFLGELDAWLESSSSHVQVIGRDERLTSSWLARREWKAARSTRRIALNNVSFVTPGGERTVLLRNALHFAREDELRALNYRMDPSLKAQVPIVRRAARRADIVVVPCSTMGDRVATFVPSVSRRIMVRPHPVSSRSWASDVGTGRELLMPILNAPYKRLDEHLSALLQAADLAGDLERIHVTARADEFAPCLANDPRVNFVGRLGAKELDRFWNSSRAVYFPTQLEAFGYPLAEARANGRRVVALETLQNREIAGAALAGYAPGSVDSLSQAVSIAMTTPVEPDRSTFDPDRYFSWLIEGRS